MVRYRYLAAALLVTAIPLAVTWAQSNSNGAPLGSRENPIKPTVIGTPLAVSTPSAKGKRGSKQNPITGQTHRRSVTVH